jgi:hypothetical protein
MRLCDQPAEFTHGQRVVSHEGRNNLCGEVHKAGSAARSISHRAIPPREVCVFAAISKLLRASHVIGLKIAVAALRGLAASLDELGYALVVVSLTGMPSRLVSRSEGRPPML